MKHYLKLAVAMAALIAIAGGAFAAKQSGAGADPQPTADEPAAREAPYIPEAEDARAREYFTDTEVIDQNGRKLRFYSDVLRGKTVLVSLFYVNCTGMCPIVNAALQLVQDELGDRQGKDIVLITVTLDPERDTPETIREYASRFEPAEGWYFLTGKPEEMAEIIRRLGHVGKIEAHKGMLMLGNVTEGVWTRARPNMPPPAIAAKLRMLSEGGFRTSGG